MANKQDAERYYALMLNALSGLQDDLDANWAPEEAKELLSELIAVCRRDYEVRFLDDG